MYFTKKAILLFALLHPGLIEAQKKNGVADPVTRSRVRSVVITGPDQKIKGSGRVYGFKIIFMSLEHSAIIKGKRIYRNWIEGKLTLSDSLYVSIETPGQDTTGIAFPLKEPIDLHTVAWLQKWNLPMQEENPEAAVMCRKHAVHIHSEAPFIYKGAQVHKLVIDSLGIYLARRKNDGFVILYTARQGVVATYNYVRETGSETFWNFIGDPALCRYILASNRKAVYLKYGPRED